MATLEFFDDPAEFLAAGGEALAADPVIGTVVAGVTSRTRDNDAAGVEWPAGVPRWWVVAREGREVVGLGMRTAQSPPHPPYLLPMPDSAAVALASTLHDRGEAVTAVNGALRAARAFADETARLAGGSAKVALHMRLFELGELVEPGPVPGALRRATRDDVELMTEWFGRFMDDADEQAGRPRGSGPHETIPADEVRRRTDQGVYFLWTDPTGAPVHVTSASLPSFGVSRIGPVYTPPEKRGHGYASAAVAEVSRLRLDAGSRVCLFTDQANPTSNAIYRRIGYRPAGDTGHLVIRR